MEIVFKYRDSELLAIPAIHNRVAFACWVNTLCYNPQTVPQAIAVELEPNLTLEMAAWIRELYKDDRSKHFRLPTMLGIMSLKSSGSASAELTTLSVTDSMVEAIRCGVELGIPVFGIDIAVDTYRRGEGDPIEDPSRVFESLKMYVEDNESVINNSLNPEVDARREEVMACRLKWLLKSYKRVLYSGGLAHWSSLKQKLENDGLLPMACDGNPEPGEFRRVLIHPRIAINFMDIFPEVSTRYENLRTFSRSGFSNDPLKMDLHRIFRSIRHETIHKYRQHCRRKSVGRMQQDNEPAILAFDTFLQRLSLVKRERIPTFATVMESARSMMPGTFSDMLFSRIMKIEPPWASPSTFPAMALLVPSQTVPETMDNMKHGLLVDLLEPDGIDFIGRRKYARRGTYVLDLPPMNRTSNHDPKSNWQWEYDMVNEKKYRVYSRWVWPPCEALLYGTSFQAARIIKSREEEKGHTAFDGSIYEGLDVKATIRSLLHNDRNIQVKTQIRLRRPAIPEGKSPDPTVFIFSDPSARSSSKWSLFMAGFTLADHVKDKERFHEVSRNQGDQFVACLGYGNSSPINNSKAYLPNYVDILDGITLFGDPCLNAIEGARWLEENDYRCCPVVRNSTFSSLCRKFYADYGIDLESYDWSTALLLAAIPFAREQVIILTAHPVQFHRSVYELAGRFRIRLHVMPLSQFPADRVEEMRKWIFIQSIDPDGCRFAPEVEEFLGQRVDAYKELLPEYVRKHSLKR